MIIIQRSAGLPFEVLRPLLGDFDPVIQQLAAAEFALRSAENTLMEAFDQALQDISAGTLRTQVYNARKAFFQKRKIIVLPSIPQASLNNGIRAYRNAVENKAVAQDKAQQYYHAMQLEGWAYLQQVAVVPAFQRALLFSSRTLLSQIPAFMQVAPVQFSKKEKGVAHSLLRYLTRMAVKTTPLSRFATVRIHYDKPNSSSLMPWEMEAEPSDNRRFVHTVAAQAQDTVKNVPNVALLNAIYDVLLRYSVFYRSLEVHLNPSLDINVAEHFSWWYSNGQEEAIQQADATPVLKFLVQEFMAHQGQMPFNTLWEKLTDITASASEATERYLLDLIDTGFIEWILPEKGQNTSWCGKLYQFLGFLPGGSSEPAITDCAYLLQWLRTAARTMPFQTVAEVWEMQQDAHTQARVFFEKYLGIMPDIAPEHIFYEDVSGNSADLVNGQMPEELKASLIALFQIAASYEMPVLHTRLAHILEKNGPMPVMELYRHYQQVLRQPDTVTPKRGAAHWGNDLPLGALVMPFTTENGQPACVLSGLYSGGGKMFARFLHLFSDDIRLEISKIYEKSQVLYPFSAYAAFNANMHPELSTRKIAVPGGNTAKNTVRMADLEAWLRPDGTPALRIQKSGKAVVFADLGLENTGSRPVLVQLLLALGQPPVSKNLFIQTSQEPCGNYFIYEPRQVFRQIVLKRAIWHIKPAFLEAIADKKGFDFFMAVRQWFHEAQIPHQFFVLQAGEHPVFVHLDSVLHIAIFEKICHSNPANLRIEEMLPVPTGHATEIAFEFTVA